MAETYKGLTIRIGGDTTGLTRALKNTSTAISNTQKQLRLLNNAAKLDPENTQLAVAKMGLLAEKAQSTRVKVGILAEQMKQLGATDVGGKTVAQLAAQTENANLKAADARATYNKLDGQLENLYIKMKEVSSVDFHNMSDAEIDKQVAALREEEIEVGKLAEELKKLKKEQKIASDEFETAKQVQEYENLKVQIKAVEAETIGLNRQWAALAIANPFIKQTEASQRFRESINQINAATRTLKTEYSTLDEALRLDPSNIDAARMKMQNLQEQVKTGSQKMKELRTRISELESAGVGEVSAKFENLALETERCKEEAAQYKTKLEAVEMAMNEVANSNPAAKQTDDWQKLEAEATQFREKLQQVQVRMDELGSAGALRNLKAELVGVSAATQAAATEMTTLNTKASGIGGAFQQLGWAMYSTVTPAMTMFGYSAINAAEQIDTAYRDMRKTVQGTEEQFEGLKQAAIDYSRTHVTTADQILEIEAMGGQLGIATDKLEGFSVAVSNIDIATDLDCDTASQQLGQLSGILNDMTEDDFTKYADALVRLGNNNATLESHISDVMLRIASMGTITGFTTPQLLAWSTAVAATGQGAEAAGTAISKTMSDIEGAVGAGGEDLQAFADVAQQSSEQFAESWNNDPSSAMYAFIQGLKNIEANGGSADNTLSELGITSVRQKQAIMGLMQTVDGLNDSMTMSNDAWNGVSDEWGQAGDAANEADKKTAGFSGAIQLLRNNFQDLGVEMGESIAPILQSLGDVIGKITQGFSDLDQNAKIAIMGFVGLAAAIGPVSVATNAVVQACKALAQSQMLKGTAWAAAIKESGTANKTLIEMANTQQRVKSGGDNAAVAIQSMGTKSKIAAVSMGLLKTAATGVAIALGTMLIEKIITDMQDAAKKADTYARATDGLKAAAEGSSQVLTDESGSLKVLGESSEAARDKIEQLREQMASHADTMNKNNEEARSNIVSLNAARDAISQYMDKSDLSAEAQGKLQAAIKLVNEQCGTQYEVTDLANGKIRDTATDADAAKDAILRLIEAKKQQIKVDNLTSNYQETLAAQAEAQDAYSISLQDYERAWEQVYPSIQEQIDAGVPMQQAWENAYGAMQPYTDELQKNKDGLDKENEALENISEQLGIASRAASGVSTAMDDLFNNNLSLTSGINHSKAAVEGMKDPLVQFRSDLEKTGASTEELANLTPEQLARLGVSYDGTIGSITSLLSEFGVSFDEAAVKTAQDAESIQSTLTEHFGPDIKSNVESVGVSFDDFSSKLANAGVSSTQLKNISSADFAEMLASCGGDVNALIGKIQEYNNQNIPDKNTNVDANGNVIDGRAESSIDNTRTSVNKLPLYRNTDVNAKGNYDDARIGIWDLGSAIKDLPLTKTISVFAQVASGLGFAEGGIRPHAAGGIIPRYHADGAIATRAMPLDIVGEAGAEAIVPLTNKKYVTPFARTVAEQMGNDGNSVVYNVYVDGAVVNDTPAIQSATYSLLAELQRKGRM